MRPVSPCTTQYLKRSVKRYSVKVEVKAEKHLKNILSEVTHVKI